MFKALKELWNRELTYRKALSQARAEERLKNVKKEAQLVEKLRLERKKTAIKSTKSFPLGAEKPKSTKKITDNIMELEF